MGLEQHKGKFTQTGTCTLMQSAQAYYLCGAEKRENIGVANGAKPLGCVLSCFDLPKEKKTKAHHTGVSTAGWLSTRPSSKQT